MYRKYVDLSDKLGRTDYEQYLTCHQSEWQEDVRKLAELYNRQGFTSGYMEGRSGVPYAVPKGKGDIDRGSAPKSWRCAGRYGYGG